MLSRLLPKPSHFRLLPLLSSKSQPYPYFPPSPPISLLRFLSTKRNNNGGEDRQSYQPRQWDFSQDYDDKFGDSLISDETPLDAKVTAGGSDFGEEKGWWAGEEDKPWSFGEEEEKDHSNSGFREKEERWVGQEDKPWSFGEEEEKDHSVFDLKEEDLRDVGETGGEITAAQTEIDIEEQKRLEEEEKQLTAVLKGPDRAFGDLIAASGITDEMLDTLIALKDFEGVEGLPPLSVIEDMRYEKNTRKSTRAEIERQKLEEMAKSRVRQVDDKGRAYGTGRRKCSVARVWVQPGDGKFIINDNEFDVYFPMLDHRAALLRPFSETKTLGLWDVKCTVKGGGVTVAARLNPFGNHMSNGGSSYSHHGTFYDN